MRSVIISLSALLLGQCAPQTKPLPPLPGKAVPTAWIEELRRYSYQSDNRALLKQFERIIAPDTLDGAHNRPHEMGRADRQPGGLLNCLFVNLDEDPAPELVGLFGYHRFEPRLAVFKEINHSWRLLYTEPVWLHGTAPELQVGNTASVHKPFYIRALRSWGTGTYCSHYQFYKLIDQHVYPCLELVDEAQEQNGALSKEVSAKLGFDATYGDALTVTFNYRFGPGHDLPRAPTGQAEPVPTGVTFVRDSRSLGYSWSQTTHRYESDRPFTQDATGAMLDSADLTAAKVAYFADLNQDSLFVQAFGYELRHLRRGGTPAQRILLREYLAAIRRNQARRPH